MKKEFIKLYQSLGIRIAYFRKMNDLTQQELGELVDIEAQHVSKLERAEVGMSMDMLFKLARALNTTASKLLDFTEHDDIQSK